IILGATVSAIAAAATAEGTSKNCSCASASRPRTPTAERNVLTATQNGLVQPGMVVREPGAVQARPVSPCETAATMVCWPGEVNGSLLGFTLRISQKASPAAKTRLYALDA